MLETHKEGSRNHQSAVERWGVMHGHRMFIEYPLGPCHQPQEKEAKRRREDWILRKRREEDNSGKKGKETEGQREGIRKQKAVEENRRERRETRRL